MNNKVTSGGEEVYSFYLNAGHGNSCPQSPKLRGHQSPVSNRKLAAHLTTQGIKLQSGRDNK